MASGELERILFVPDTHVPYEDKKAFALLLEAAKVFKPDEIVIMGDFADFYSVSAHDKSPARGQSLVVEVNAVLDALARLGKYARSKKTYLCGNHEDRLARYLSQRAPALYGALDVQTLFKLEQTGWDFVPYRETYRLGKLNCTHDTGTAGPNAHRQASTVYRGSAVIGHTHRLGYDVLGVANGRPHLAAMFGWLGDYRQVDYLHKAKAAQWCLGFGVGWRDRSSGIVHVHPVPIINYTCVVEGKLLENP